MSYGKDLGSFLRVSHLGESGDSCLVNPPAPLAQTTWYAPCRRSMTIQETTAIHDAPPPHDVNEALRVLKDVAFGSVSRTFSRSLKNWARWTFVGRTPSHDFLNLYKLLKLLIYSYQHHVALLYG
jgi:hypothetical protein